MRKRAEIGDSSPFCRRLAKKINSWPLLRGAVEAIASSVAPRFVFPSRKGQFPNSAAQVSMRSFDLRKRGSQARAARAERREGGPPEQTGSALPERDPQGFQIVGRRFRSNSPWRSWLANLASLGFNPAPRGRSHALYSLG